MSDLEHSSETIAKAIAEANHFGHLWESYHPVVKQTLEWLDEHHYLQIVDLDGEFETVLPKETENE